MSFRTVHPDEQIFRIFNEGEPQYRLLFGLLDKYFFEVSLRGLT
jgi:hypothetical protein